MNEDNIRMLTYEQKVKYRAAIAAGYFGGYDANPREWRHTFIGSYIWKYPGRVKMMTTLGNILGHTPTWDDMTEYTLKDLVEELYEQGKAPSSIKTLCGELKAVLNDNHKIVPCDKDDYQRILSIKGTVSQAVYLTREEMSRVIAYKPAGELQRYVHRNFVVEMLTGARLVDSIGLSINNCDKQTGLLSYVPKKTPGIVVRVPIDERFKLRRFLADHKKRNTGIDVFNETVRAICRNCKINTLSTITRANKTVTTEKWRLVSSHTARRTFATNLYLAGVTLEDIAIMMGHGKNIETTKRYICAERQVTPAVIAYFKPTSENDMLPNDKTSIYNKAISDVVEVLDTLEMLEPDGIVYREILALRK